MKFVDIHSHIIFDVDDGSNSLEQSVKYLNELKKIGLENVICTPHVRSGNIDKLVKIKDNYIELKKEAKKIGINLYLGNEIMYSDKVMRLLERNRLLTLNNTKYVLVEFKRGERLDIQNVVAFLEDLVEKGYKPILAHPELYINYRDINYMYKIKETGTMLQLDATSLFDKNKKFAKKLLKERLVDIVASDSHCTRKRNYKNYMKAYRKINKKFGDDYANVLFIENPSLLLKRV